jgi:hypothetical protein
MSGNGGTPSDDNTIHVRCGDMRGRAWRGRIRMRSGRSERGLGLQSAAGADYGAGFAQLPGSHRRCGPQTRMLRKSRPAPAFVVTVGDPMNRFRRCDRAGRDDTDVRGDTRPGAGQRARAGSLSQLHHRQGHHRERHQREAPTGRGRSLGTAVADTAELRRNRQIAAQIAGPTAFRACLEARIVWRAAKPTAE